LQPDQNTGAISASSLTTNLWHDPRGETMAVPQLGGLVTKMQYDGAGRLRSAGLKEAGEFCLKKP
jgi:YD repeat-containing protein